MTHLPRQGTKHVQSVPPSSLPAMSVVRLSRSAGGSTTNTGTASSSLHSSPLRCWHPSALFDCLLQLHLDFVLVHDSVLILPHHLHQVLEWPPNGNLTAIKPVQARLACDNKQLLGKPHILAPQRKNTITP